MIISQRRWSTVLLAAFASGCAYDAFGPSIALPDHCRNDAKDPGETDTDCGGDCAGCGNTKRCVTNDDCAIGACVSGACGCKPKTEAEACTGRCELVDDGCDGKVRCAPAGMKLLVPQPFVMGAEPPIGDARTTPAFDVAIDPYCIDVNEVSAGQYAVCVADSGACSGDVHEASATPGVDTDFCNYNDREKHANHPMNCVTWAQALAFCQWRGFALPTEAQWEFSARAGNAANQYPWGAALPDASRTNGCGKECTDEFARRGRPLPYGVYAASDAYIATAPVDDVAGDISAVGIHDLAGNVAEWVADWNGTYPVLDFGERKSNWKGPTDGTLRIIRGAAFSTTDRQPFQTVFRSPTDPSKSYVTAGMRCAVSIGPL